MTNPPARGGLPLAAVAKRRFRAALAEPDRGSAPVELAVIGPAAILLLALTVLGGRVAIAHQDLAGVAANAARQASLARTPAAARTAARAAAATALRADDLHCAGTPGVNVDITGLSRAAQAGAAVTVRVSCTVSFDQIGMPGLPGSRTLTAQASSPVDPFRTTP